MMGLANSLRERLDVGFISIYPLEQTYSATYLCHLLQRYILVVSLKVA